MRMLCTIWISWLVLIFTGCNSEKQARNAVPPLDETLAASDTMPLGASAAFELANRLVKPSDPMIMVDQDFRSFWSSSKSDEVNLYFSLSRQFYPSDSELESLLGYLQGGRTAFISAGAFSKTMLDTLHLELLGQPLPWTRLSYDSGTVQLDSNYASNYRSFSYFYRPATRFFKLDSTIALRVLGYNSFGYPNFIHVFVGNGNLFLHAEPEVFSNYFLMQKSNALYALSSWQYLPEAVGAVAWDDFYQARKFPLPPADRATGLTVLFRHPGMRSAGWLLLILFVLYLWFGSKRKQRIIPIHPANVNTSVAFAETMGRLYFQQHNNRNLADKIIRYFQEQVRQHYFLHINLQQKEWPQLLSRKTSVPLAEVEQLFTCIRQVEMAADVSDELLLRLNSYIENFHKKRQA